MDSIHHVFVSHYNGDDEHIQRLKDLVGRKGYTLKNGSIDSTKPNWANNEEYIKRLLRLRIQWASTFICLIGPETHTRKWVNWEIEQAHKKGKHIIGVFINGAKEDSVVPENLEKYGHGLTGWNSDKIIQALEWNEIGWCDYNGVPRPERRTVRVAVC
jgi:hypothetical protein